MRNKGLPKATSFLLLAIYEVIVAFLFVVYTFSFSTSGGALSVQPDPSQESIWLLLLFFAPLLLSHTSKLSLPFFGARRLSSRRCTSASRSRCAASRSCRTAQSCTSMH